MPPGLRSGAAARRVVSEASEPVRQRDDSLPKLWKGAWPPRQHIPKQCGSALLRSAHSAPLLWRHLSAGSCASAPRTRSCAAPCSTGTAARQHASYSAAQPAASPLLNMGAPARIVRCISAAAAAEFASGGSSTALLAATAALRGGDGSASAASNARRRAHAASSSRRAVRRRCASSNAFCKRSRVCPLARGTAAPQARTYTAAQPAISPALYLRRLESMPNTRWVFQGSAR